MITLTELVAASLPRREPRRSWAPPHPDEFWWAALRRLRRSLA